MPRRWLQFSLRFLFATMLASACFAWWFRPGVVKPEFSLERFSREKDGHSSKVHIEAHFRLTNAGPDSILLDESRYLWRIEGKVDENGWADGGGGTMSLPSNRIRLKPRESTVFVVRIDDDARTVQLGVDIADRCDQREKPYWSPSFPIPDDLLASTPR